MINVTELRSGKIFEDEGLWEVLTYEHIKTGRGGGNVKVKARNVRTGTTVEKSFQTGARVQDISTEKKKAAFLYVSGDDVVFMDNENYEQFEIPKKVIGDSAKFLKEGAEAVLQLFDGEVLGVELPKNLEFVVSDGGVGIKGDSVSNVWKKAILENGIEVDVPLFIKTGDKVRVDTRTGQYIERVK